MQIGTESEYVQYRTSAAGGAYRAKAYSILEIYDEFGYGIEKHPQAIRNFVEFMQRKWPAAKMIFIVGRGIEYNRSRYATGSWESAFLCPHVDDQVVTIYLQQRSGNLSPDILSAD